MRKTLLLTLLLLISTVWLQAQDAAQTSSATTIQGCLQYTKGHYRLTEDNGTVHQLSGEANQLTKHVGHEVEITGMPGVRTVGTTIQGAASSVTEEKVFKVKSVKHVADACTSATH